MRDSFINASVEVLGFNTGGPSSSFFQLLVCHRSGPPLPGGSGNGGEINIETERRVVAEGGQVSVATNSPNTAGDINIRASESVELRRCRTRAQRTVCPGPSRPWCWRKY